MVKITEADVYHTLSYHVWKSALEICHELRKAKGVEDPLESLESKTKREIIVGILRDVNIGTIYIHLNNIEEQGFVERRYRDLTEEQLAVRGRHSQTEYRLTPSGIQNRDKYEKKETLGLEATFRPI